MWIHHPWTTRRPVTCLLASSCQLPDSWLGMPLPLQLLAMSAPAFHSPLSSAPASPPQATEAEFSIKTEVIRWPTSQLPSPGCYSDYICESFWLPAIPPHEKLPLFVLILSTRPMFSFFKCSSSAYKSPQYFFYPLSSPSYSLLSHSLYTVHYLKKTHPTLSHFHFLLPGPSTSLCPLYFSHFSFTGSSNGAVFSRCKAQHRPWQTPTRGNAGQQDLISHEWFHVSWGIWANEMGSTGDCDIKFRLRRKTLPTWVSGMKTCNRVLERRTLSAKGQSVLALL